MFLFLSLHFLLSTGSALGKLAMRPRSTESLQELVEVARYPTARFFSNTGTTTYGWSHLETLRLSKAS